jgi:hypothetical protein
VDPKTLQSTEISLAFTRNRNFAVQPQGKFKQLPSNVTVIIVYYRFKFRMFCFVCTTLLAFLWLHRLRKVSAVGAG